MVNGFSGSPLSPKIPTARVPHIPQIPWTEIAPTGSSIFCLSKNKIEKTTIAPAVKPMIIESDIPTTSAPAVIPTRAKT